MNIFFEANGLVQNPNSEVGIFTYDDKTGYTTVNRDKFFNNWWKYSNSNFAAKIQAAYGVGSTPTNEKQIVHHDKEETTLSSRPMNRLLFIIAFALAALNGVAQVNVSGVVVEEGTNEPLTGASVILRTAEGKIKKYATSDANGKFYNLHF